MFYDDVNSFRRMETGAKQRLMTSYKDRYPRRSAFREEMRNYGWIDVKRR